MQTWWFWVRVLVVGKYGWRTETQARLAARKRDAIAGKKSQLISIPSILLMSTDWRTGIGLPVPLQLAVAMAHTKCASIVQRNSVYYSKGMLFTPMQTLSASEMQIVAINLRQVGENLLLELALKAVSAVSLKAILSLGSRIEESGN